MADHTSSAEPVPQVLQEIQSGQGLALSAVGRLFPAHRGTGTVDPSTVFRWVTKGAKTPAGDLVKLEAVRVGGRWLTSRGAVARFVAALTAAADSAPVLPTRTPAQQQRAGDVAGRKLVKMRS